jgi:hypothetical protein
MSSQMSTGMNTLYPPGGFGAPKNRRGHADDTASIGLPPGVEVFSADNHISLAADIFYERFPDDLRDEAPRIWYETVHTWSGSRASRSSSTTSARS